MDRTPENEYPYLRGWSKMMDSYPYSVEPPQLAIAREEGISQLVIYKARIFDPATQAWTDSPIWVEIDPLASPGSFADRVLRYVEEHYKLSYSQVKAWDTEVMGKNKTTRNEYPFVRGWGVMMGSYPYYITAQVEQAKTDKAPQTAIYKRSPIPGEDWSDRTPADLWQVIDPNGKPTNGGADFHQLVLDYVKREYGLSYEDVLEWEKASEQA